MDKEGSVLEVVHILSMAALSCVAIGGCASTPPWVGGIDRSEYYYQGVGHGQGALGADRAAVLELCASIHGTDVESVQEDFQREHGVLGSQIFE